MEAKEVKLLLETAKYFICLADTVMKSNIRLSQEAVNLFNDYFVKQFVFINYLQSMNYSFGANYNNAVNVPCGSLHGNSQYVSASAPAQTASLHPSTSISMTAESLVKDSEAFIGTSPKHEAANQLMELSKSITAIFSSFIDGVFSKKIQCSKVYCHLCDALLNKKKEWSQHVLSVNHRDTFKSLVSRGKRMQMYECSSCVVSIYGDIDDLQSLIEYHNNFIHFTKANISDKGLNGSSKIVHSVSSESLLSKASSSTSLYSNRDTNHSLNSAPSSSLPKKVNTLCKFFTTFVDKNYLSGLNSVIKCTFCQPCMVWCRNDKDWIAHSEGKSHKKTNMDIISQNKDMFFYCNGCGLSIFGLQSSIGKLIEYHNEKVHGPLNCNKSSTSSVETPLPKSQDSMAKSSIKASYYDSILRYLEKTKMTFYCALCDKYLDEERLKVHIVGSVHKNCVKSTIKSKSLKMFTCVICSELTVFGEEQFVVQLFEQHYYNHKQAYLDKNKEFTCKDIKREIDWNEIPVFKLTNVKNTSSKNISQGKINESKGGPRLLNTSTPTPSDIQKKQNDKQLSKDKVTSKATSFSNKGTNSVSSECLKNMGNEGNTSSKTGGNSGQLTKSDSAGTNIESSPNTSSGCADNDDCITNLYLGYVDALSSKLITDIGMYCHPCDIVLNKGMATSQHLSSKKHISSLDQPENFNATYKQCNICGLSIFGNYRVLNILLHYHVIKNHNHDNTINMESSVDKYISKENQDLSVNSLNPNSTSNDDQTKLESNSHLIKTEQSPYAEFENLIAGMVEEFSTGVEAEGGYCTVCNMGFLMDAFSWEFHLMEHRNNPSNVSHCTLQSCDKCSLKIFGIDHNKFFNLPSHKSLH